MTATQPNSTPARPMSAWALNGLIEFTRAAHWAVDEDRAGELFALEGSLWTMLVRKPIQSAQDARAKLDAMLSDLERRDEIDPISADIVRQVMRWLDAQ